MSFDIFLQRFVDGDGTGGGNAEARGALHSCLARDAKGRIIGLPSSDGGADVYGLDDENRGGCVANHVSGRQTWFQLVQAARGGLRNHAGRAPSLCSRAATAGGVTR